MDELMQNSLARLFAGINDALVGAVLPAVDDEFAACNSPRASSCSATSPPASSGAPTC